MFKSFKNRPPLQRAAHCPKNQMKTTFFSKSSPPNFPLFRLDAGCLTFPTVQKYTALLKNQLFSD
jgi:hypothetical protein